MNGYELANAALADMHDIWMHIARNDPKAADRLVERLTACFEMLGRQPLIGEPRDEVSEGLRSFPVGNYVVYHRVIDEAIRILRVLHGARDVDAILGDRRN